jgi:alginate O-acetyltransferase complex protein AlgI
VLFPTVEYGLFFLVAFAAAWALRRQLVAHKAFLLAASYAFYAFWDWRFLPVLVGLSLLAALVAQALEVAEDGAQRKLILSVGVAASLFSLALFKYLAFGAATVLAFGDWLGLPPAEVRLPDVGLPVGISFFAFHAISLMVDTYRRRIPVPVRLLDALLYVAFFPQLVAGPILRAASFLPELAKERDAERIEVARALQLIALGLTKKVLIANVLAGRLVDPVFESTAGRSGLEVLLAIYGYAAQIYCDFSGYTDIALGSALLLGYTIPQNFDAPYTATSPQDFWRRWHISLSSWLRDYLFIPLGGSKHGPLRTALALALTMVLGGLWHGAAWTFVIWGAFHAVGLIAHRAWASWREPAVVALRETKWFGALAQLFTFHFVCAGWVLFRAPSLSVAGEVFTALGQSGALKSVGGTVLLALGLGLLGQRLSEGALARVRGAFARLPIAAQGLAFALAVLALDVLGPRGIAPFIYFRF